MVSKKKPSYRNNRPKWLKGSIKYKTILEALAKFFFKDAPEGDGSLPRMFLKRGNSPHTNHHKTTTKKCVFPCFLSDSGAFAVSFRRGYFHRSRNRVESSPGIHLFHPHGFSSRKSLAAAFDPASHGVKP